MLGGQVRLSNTLSDMNLVAKHFRASFLKGWAFGQKSAEDVMSVLNTAATFDSLSCDRRENTEEQSQQVIKYCADFVELLRSAGAAVSSMNHDLLVVTLEGRSLTVETRGVVRHAIKLLPLRPYIYVALELEDGVENSLRLLGRMDLKESPSEFMRWRSLFRVQRKAKQLRVFEKCLCNFCEYVAARHAFLTTAHR